jgi:hypothetical protein
MLVEIVKWGNSTPVRLPAAILKQVRSHPGRPPARGCGVRKREEAHKCASMGCCKPFNYPGSGSSLRPSAGKHSLAPG